MNFKIIPSFRFEIMAICRVFRKCQPDVRFLEPMASRVESITAYLFDEGGDVLRVGFLGSRCDLYSRRRRRGLRRRRRSGGRLWRVQNHTGHLRLSLVHSSLTTKQPT